MNTITNPFKLKSTKALQKALAGSTLEGGTEGSDNTTPEAHLASSVDAPSGGPDLATCLDAMLGIHQAYEARSRPDLDAAYELLQELLEEYRNAVPKA